MSMMLTGRKSKNCLPKNANGWLIKCRSIFVRSMRCSMMNAKGFGSGTRNTMKPILVTMCNISSGSSASLVSSFSAWLSSCYSIAITTGRSNILFPTWLVGFILGTTNPLIIDISAENQWVWLFVVNLVRMINSKLSLETLIPNVAFGMQIHYMTYNQQEFLIQL